MHSSSILFKKSVIRYTVGGMGSQLLLCFHGYGETGQSFHFLENYISHQYKIITIDLPYHGNTKWEEGMHFEIDDLIQIIETLFQKENINGQNFTLVGYSMGGRIALSLLQYLSSRIGRLILIAPDGLKINFWYWLSTQTRIGNTLFAATIHNPRIFLILLHWVNRIGFVNQSIYKFVNHFLHDKMKRKQLYLRWTCFRKYKPDLKKIKKIIAERSIPIHLLYGIHDRIITPARGEDFRKHIESHCTIELVNSGHQLLQENNAAAIVQYLTV